MIVYSRTSGKGSTKAKIGSNAQTRLTFALKSFIWKNILASSINIVYCQWCVRLQCFGLPRSFEISHRTRNLNLLHWKDVVHCAHNAGNSCFSVTLTDHACIGYGTVYICTKDMPYPIWYWYWTIGTTINIGYIYVKDMVHCIFVRGWAEQETENSG